MMPSPVALLPTEVFVPIACSLNFCHLRLDMLNLSLRRDGGVDGDGDGDEDGSQ